MSINLQIPLDLLNSELSNIFEKIEKGEELTSIERNIFNRFYFLVRLILKHYR